MKRQTRFASIVLALIGCIAARWAAPFPLEYSIGLLPIAVAVALFFVYEQGFRTVGLMREMPRWRRTSITTAVIALAFSSFLVWGSWVSCPESEGISILHLLAVVLNAFPLFMVIMMIWHWFDNRQASALLARASMPSSPSSGEGIGVGHAKGGPGIAEPKGSQAWVQRIVENRWWPLGCFVLLLLCWLPVFLAAYPGFFCYDMSVGDYAEWAQFSTKELYSHHPVLHTLFLGTIIRVVADLTGSFNVGVTVFVGIQALMVAGVFSYVLGQLRNMSRLPLLCLGALAYLALDPIVSMFALCTTKDTLFSAFTVLLAVLVYGYFSTKERRGLEQLIALGLTATAVCVLRPNGLVAFVIAIPLLLAIAQRGARARLGAACAAALAVSIVWLGPAAWALGVHSTDLQRYNALSIPIQQLVCVYQDHATKEEQDWLESLGYQNECLYEPQIADAGRWNVMDMPMDAFAEAYVAMGVRYPQVYFTALLEQTQMAWNPYSYIDIYHDRAYTGRDTSLFGFDWESPAIAQPLLPMLHDALERVSGWLTLQNVPLLALLASIPFYVWTLCLASGRAFIVRDRGAMAVCTIFGLLTLSALMGPCVLVRYYLYLVFGLPLLVGMLLAPTGASQKP